MNLEKLKPWNWFKHEEDSSGKAVQVPVARNEAEYLPAGSLMNLHREMDRWFDDAFKSFGMPSLPSRFESSMPAFNRPRIDVSADNNRYQICLDVPGLTQDELSLEVSGDVLTIRGEKEQRSEDKDKHYYRMERSYGAFQRTLALPDDANADEISASLDKGVLTLEIPRRAGSAKEVKKIEISS